MNTANADQHREVVARGLDQSRMRTLVTLHVRKPDCSCYVYHFAGRLVEQETGFPSKLSHYSICGPNQFARREPWTS